MESYFATLFEDIRHERSLILILSLTDSNLLNIKLASQTIKLRLSKTLLFKNFKDKLILSNT